MTSTNIEVHASVCVYVCLYVVVRT